MKIVEQDGPLPKYSAFRPYVKNSGIQQVTRPVRHLLSRTTYELVRIGKLIQLDEYPAEKPKHAILRVCEARPALTPSCAQM